MPSSYRGRSRSYPTQTPYNNPYNNPYTYPSPPKLQCTITWDSAAEAYSCATPYQPNFIEFIKTRIPGKQRAWDATQKLWFVKEDWLDIIQTLATELWGADAVKVITRKEVEDAERVQVRAQQEAILAALPERERAFYDFLTALPFEAMQAAYRRAALLLHPDRNPTDGEAMAKLNAAWSKIEKEYSK